MTLPSGRVPISWPRLSGRAVCISWKPLTSPLLHRDMGEPEGGEEALLVLKLGRLVHLLGREAGAERRRGRRALGLRRGGRRAALPEQPPPLPPLLQHQLVMAAPGRQAKQRDEVQFLCPKEREQKEQRGKKDERISVLPPAPAFGSVARRACVCWQVLYLAGVIQFERGLLRYSPEMSSHLLLITFII